MLPGIFCGIKILWYSCFAQLLIAQQIITAASEEETGCGLREVLKDDLRTLSPWTVSIFIRSGEHKPWQYLLAGTIINPTTVLTLFGGEFGAPTRGSKYTIPTRDNVKIVAGLRTTSLSSKDYFTQEANVSFITPFTKHEANNKVFHLYIGHLSTALNLDTPFVKAICLPEIFHQPDQINDNFYLGGYAPINGSKGMKSLEVKKINLMETADCNDEFQKLYDGASKHVFCGRKAMHYASEACILHGATLMSSPINVYRNPRETRWYLAGILAMIPSLKYNQCDRDTLYMVTSLEDSLSWIRQNIDCGPNKFACNSGDCIPLKNVCDGVPNCGDSGGIRNSNDENSIFCTASNPCKTKKVYFHQCGLNQECISPLQICDGRKDCENGADENPGVCSLNIREVIALQEVKHEIIERRAPANGSCPLLQLTEGVIATCKNLGNNKNIPCAEAMVNDEMTLDCDIQYKPTSRATSSKMICGSDGSWRPHKPFYCERECGIINSGLTFHLSFATRTTNALAFPWYTAIFRNQSGTMEFICGGSLIEPKIIITAAHCVVSSTGQLLPPEIFHIVVAPVSASFDENKKDAFAQIIHVRDVHVPPTFTITNLQSDLAILELRKPVVFGDFVLPVCYLPPFYTDYPTQGIVGKVAGLGYDENNQLSAVVKFSDFPVVDQATCKEALGHILPLNTFCAGFQNGTAVCKGDSGGGLVFPVTSGQQNRYVLKGIVSHGLLSANRVCDRENYSVFTHVDAFSEWISSTIVMSSKRRKRFDFR